MYNIGAAMLINAMITEDDLFSMTILCDLLEDYFPEVRVLGIAETVKDTVEFLREHPVDLLFLDIELPDGKGPDVFKSIQDRNMKVIVTTSFPRYIEEQGSDQILHTILKPLTYERLTAAMEIYLKYKETA